jgi:hypothetical protein
VNCHKQAQRSAKMKTNLKQLAGRLMTGKFNFLPKIFLPARPEALVFLTVIFLSFMFLPSIFLPAYEP